ncbi:SDR family NAD(P)-dependent oxidoreductase [Sphingorhabdus sp. EL138]|uniref:SDR family NAD(P)-dependent oxidoreductase n=1 Tax=Sphingorhabdus sp. EL138 TaxID=2073156 RepID=UPI0025CDCF63|nr:SDR family NAD(P)-dependent oxidoreductase [Sphingorhabdus sp. EL138]
MTDQAQKTAWITGASSGIGEALAKAFVASGGYAILSGRNVAELQRVAAETGAADHCLILPFDTVDYASLASKVAEAIAFQGHVDVLVNNAGISQRSPALDTDLSVYQRIVDVDLLAPIALTQALLSHMVSRGSGQIVMISSVAGKAGIPMRTAYCAAKHGLIGYADALRSEVAGQGVKILVVAPGSVKTNVSRNALNADGSVRGISDAAIDNGIDPNEVASRIWEAVRTGKREIIIAEGIEANIPVLRAQDPEKLFDMVEAMVADGYAKKISAR